VDHDGWKYNVNALHHATDAEVSNATRPVENSTGLVNEQHVIFVSN
jgi:hypothetical protein